MYIGPWQEYSLARLIKMNNDSQKREKEKERELQELRARQALIDAGPPRANDAHGNGRPPRPRPSMSVSEQKEYDDLRSKGITTSHAASTVASLAPLMDQAGGTNMTHNRAVALA